MKWRRFELGFRWCARVLIPSGIRVEKFDEQRGVWVYFDTLPDHAAVDSLIENSL